jgi:hypothetical protein
LAKSSHAFKKLHTMWSFLIDNLPITLFTHNTLCSLWSIGSDNINSTLGTMSLMEFTWVPESHSFFMSLIWMFGRNREMIFYIEDEFLSDNFK